MTRLVAMIPARMGSKRIPRKNARLMCGKPLLQYAVDAAIQASCFQEIWVNSESELLGELARSLGVGYHRRPAELAVDTATNQDFTAEFLRRRECDYVVMVNPTSPLLRVETIRRFCDVVSSGAYDTVLSVLEEKAECFFRGAPVNFRTIEKINSQDLEPVQKVVWALTAWRRESFLAFAAKGECSVFSGALGLFPVPLAEAMDIDTQEQWDVAEGMIFASKNPSGQRDNIAYWGTCES